MSVSVPMPTFKVKVLHVSDGFELVTTKASGEPNAQQLAPLELRPKMEETTENIHFLITTGAGSKISATKTNGEFIFQRSVLQLTKHPTFEGRTSAGSKLKSSKKGINKSLGRKIALELTKDMGIDGGYEFFPVNISMFTNAGEHGIRQCGFADFNPVKLTEAAYEGKSIEVKGQMFVHSQNSTTTEVQLQITPIESGEWRASAGEWLKTSLDVEMIKSRTVSREQVAKQMNLAFQARNQRIYEIMGSTYGNLNDPVNINKVGILADTNGYMNEACPQQANQMLLKFNENTDMLRKNVVVITRTAVQAAAEVCASYETMGVHGEQSITTPQFIQFLQTNTKQGVATREQVFKDIIRAIHSIMRGPNVQMDGYLGDECYKLTGNSISSIIGDSEKMDLTCGPPSKHFDLTQQYYQTLMNDNQGLLREQQRLQQQASVGEQVALAKIEEKLNQNNSIMMQLVQSQNCKKKDCEDGSFQFVVTMEALKNSPQDIYKQIHPFISKSFLPMESMFPSGNVDTLFESESAKVQAIHFIVETSLQLVSEALKWQSQPVNGTFNSYKACFGLASAPSLKQDGVLSNEKKSITREMCKSYEDLLVHKYQGETLAGHCWTVLAQVTPVINYACGAQIANVTVSCGGLCETTVPNTNGGLEDMKVGINERIGMKNLNISIDGHNLCLQNVPHSQARAAIGEVVLKKVNSQLGKELLTVSLVDMELGAMDFYKLFSQMGGAQCVSGEITNSKNITSMLNASATGDALHSLSPNISFCTSTIAWDGCALPSHKTETITVSVPLTAEEDRRIQQIAHELTPLHLMTEEHLAFFMNNMGKVVNVGFDEGKFFASDFSGTRLDSETRIAHFFVVSLTPLAQSLPKYWKNPSGINALIQSQMQTALPGLAVRVRQIETGLHVMQVVVDS